MTPYPYDQFQDDFLTYLALMEEEISAFERMGNGEVKLDLVRAADFLRTFMETREPDETARTRKSLAIMQVLFFIVTHADEFDVGTQFVKGETVMAISHYLVEATYRHHFPNGTYPGVEEQPDPKDVLLMANQLEEQDS